MCLCVRAEISQIFSNCSDGLSPLISNKRGNILINEPLPLSCSLARYFSKCSSPICLDPIISLSSPIDLAVVILISKTSPLAVHSLPSFQAINFLEISTKSYPPNSESARHKVKDVSSDQVPIGWLWLPNPIISVAGFFSISSFDLNSNGTPNASPTAMPNNAPYILFFAWLAAVLDCIFINNLIVDSYQYNKKYSPPYFRHSPSFPDR